MKKFGARIPAFDILANRHTGVVVYGREYYYGDGIRRGQPVCDVKSRLGVPDLEFQGATPYGKPVKVEDLGTTSLPRDTFHEFIYSIRDRYTA